jgi:SAM-dependent methyltransferase
VQHPELWQPSRYVPDSRGGWRVNRDYVRSGSWFFCQRVLGAYVEAITANARGRLLDAGCGDVPYYGLYRDRVDEVTCIDWPGSSHGALHVDVPVDLNGALPFADARFDTVLLTDVLEHIARPAALLGEIARVLAPGGRLVATVPFLYWVHEAPHDYFRYTQHGLRSLAATAGLAVVSLDAYGGYPDVVLDLAGKGVVRGTVAGRLHAGVGGWLSSRSAYRRLAQRTAAAFPLGFVLVAAKT